MTFDQIRSEVLERMSLSSTDASTRVGAAINRHYKRVTSLLGMETTRYVSKDVLMTIGVRTVTVPGVEKVDRVADISGQPRPLSEVSLHQMRSLEPTAVEPQVWALSNTQAQSVVLMFDTFPTFAWTLRIDGWTTLTDLTGSGEPAFPASFHDILTWFVLAEELLRKEKSQLAAAYEQKAAGLLEDLRFHLADTHTRTLVQNSHPGGATGGSGQGGGGGAPGGAQYLTNIPPGTVVGRASDQGTGNSQPITTGPHLLMTGSVLDAVGYVDTSGTPGAGAIAEFADANTIRAATRTLVDKTGTPAANQIAIFGDADTLTGAANLTYAGSVLQVGGGQMRFPTTQNPSADPTTFDDYREVNWTPVINGLFGQSGQIYAIQNGRYIKTGRLIVASFKVGLSTMGTFSGDICIRGFPAAGAASGTPDFAAAVSFQALATNWASLSLVLPATYDAALLRGAPTPRPDLLAMTASDLTNTTEFSGTLTYFVDN